jgi:8-amino-7-oxononanoate synthase
MPVDRRSELWAWTAARGRGAAALADRAFAAERARGSATISSTSDPHVEHEGHWPSQRGETCPHCWQANAVRRALSTMAAIEVDNGAPSLHQSPVQPLDDELAAELTRIEGAGLRRVLRPLSSGSAAEVMIAGRPVLLLSSNNYLGLADHPAIVAASCEATRRWGCGTGASRLISGHLDLHAEVEAQLAAFKGTEAALLFPSGYQANVGTIGALVGRGDHVFSDALNHASIIDGCRLSRASVHVYPHRDARALEAMLAATPQGGRRLIVTDSVFSMDGDRAPLRDLVALARAYHTSVFLDEAHAAGVLGPRGAGLAEEEGLAADVAVQMGTLGKALGGAGAYVAGSRALIDVVANRARSFVYTTGLAPGAVAAAGAALRLVAAEPERRTRLLRTAARLRGGLTAAGLRAEGDTHIIPVMLGDNGLAMRFADALLERGVLAHAIRPPTVPRGTARLRVTPMATHTEAQIDRTLDAFAAVARATGATP